MSMSMSHVRLFALCSSLLTIAIGTDARLSWPENRAALFVFGDSLFDVGTNNFIDTTASFRADFVPYGETFFKYPTGRFSDGRLIPDFIAEFAGLPLIPPYLQPGKFQFVGGVNFASTGAGALVETYEGYVVNLEAQMRQFEKLAKKLRRTFGDDEAEKTVSEAVYMISIGANDYLLPLTMNSTLFQSHTHEEYVAMVTGNLTTVLKNIHSKGGRKFGLMNMGPLGCVPVNRALAGTTGACLDEINGIISLHNRVLPRALEKLENELDGFKYSIFDFFNAGFDLFNKPLKYGFKEGIEACCGSGRYRGNFSCGGKRGETEYELCKDPSEYVFFDSSHLSERVYRRFAKSMWRGSPPITGPYNIEALFKLA